MNTSYENIMSFLAGLYCRLLCGVRSEKGQTIIEYALLLVLIAVVVVLMVKGVGLTANNTYSRINCAVKDAVN